MSYPESGIPGYSKDAFDQVRRAGGCEHPIQLRGSVALGGEVVWSTQSLPGEVAYVPCKTRKASQCRPCSRLYQGDAFQLIVAGLRGGKGVPESVQDSPAVFFTLTAPSFGAVHTQNAQRRCLPRRDAPVCVHGVAASCGRRHVDGDPLLGQPLCGECFDYRSAVLWNAHASALWRVTRIAIDRQLSRATGDDVRAQYVKVAEFQRRGLVHFHVALRVDGAESSAIVEQAIRTAVKAASVATPEGRITWGRQLDIAEIRPSDQVERQLSRSQVAGYLAKYATKGSDGNGSLDARLKTSTDIDFRNVNPHLRRLVKCAWRVASEFPELRSDRWSHQFGFRGHFCTKSRGWSTTFTALRAARAEHQRQLRDESWRSLSDSMLQQVERRWSFVGSGYRNSHDEFIASVLRSKKQAA